MQDDAASGADDLSGRNPVEGTHYDLRTEQVLGTRKIDVTYTDLDRDADGRARVRLSLPGGPAVALWGSLQKTEKIVR